MQQRQARVTYPWQRCIRKLLFHGQAWSAMSERQDGRLAWASSQSLHR